MIVTSVLTTSCGSQFLMTLDFFAPPPASGQTLDIQGITKFLNTNPGFLDPGRADIGQPGFLDEAQFGLQYVQRLELPSK